MDTIKVREVQDWARCRPAGKAEMAIRAAGEALPLIIALGWPVRVAL
jgi:hypothetical protein